MVSLGPSDSYINADEILKYKLKPGIVFVPNTIRIFLGEVTGYD